VGRFEDCCFFLGRFCFALRFAAFVDLCCPLGRFVVGGLVVVDVVGCVVDDELIGVVAAKPRPFFFLLTTNFQL
jgi:hypothetical protein